MEFFWNFVILRGPEEFLDIDPDFVVHPRPVDNMAVECVSLAHAGLDQHVIAVALQVVSSCVGAHTVVEDGPERADQNSVVCAPIQHLLRPLLGQHMAEHLITFCTFFPLFLSYGSTLHAYLGELVVVFRISMEFNVFFFCKHIAESCNI